MLFVRRYCAHRAIAVTAVVLLLSFMIWWTTHNIDQSQSRTAGRVDHLLGLQITLESAAREQDGQIVAVTYRISGLDNLDAEMKPSLGLTVFEKPLSRACVPINQNGQVYEGDAVFVRRFWIPRSVSQLSIRQQLTLKRPAVKRTFVFEDITNSGQNVSQTLDGQTLFLSDVYVNRFIRSGKVEPVETGSSGEYVLRYVPGKSGTLGIGAVVATNSGGDLPSVTATLIDEHGRRYPQKMGFGGKMPHSDHVNEMYVYPFAAITPLPKRLDLELDCEAPDEKADEGWAVFENVPIVSKPKKPALGHNK